MVYHDCIHLIIAHEGGNHLLQLLDYFFDESCFLSVIRIDTENIGRIFDVEFVDGVKFLYPL